MATSLSIILNRAERFQAIKAVSRESFVRDIDTFLATEQNAYKYPFRLRKTTVRVFDGVFFYPTESDYDELAFLDDQQGEDYQRPEFIFNSMKQFLEDQDYQNRWAEIWNNGVVYTGIKYKSDEATSSQLVDAANDASNYTGTGDAGTPVDDTVFFLEGESSIRVPVVESTDVATVSWTFDQAIADTNYRQKYFFVDVYLNSVPTSIDVRFGTDSSNYVETTVTTQFSGQAFEANNWNRIAIDLNTATETGVIDSSSFNYAAIDINGVTTGNYYIDASYLRRWELLDKWYYSKNACLTNAGTYQEGFYDLTTDTYSEDTQLVGTNEWSYVVQYGAMLITYADQGADTGEIAGLFAKAQQTLKERYPSNREYVTDTMWDFHHPSQPPLTGYAQSGYVLK